MKSSRRHHRAKRGRWAHVNTPDGLRRRSAANDARREAIVALLPPVDPGPAPLSVWQTVLVLDSRGDVLNRITLHVPTAGRCDQHAADVDGERSLMTATEVGRRVAAMILKRPSVALQASIRREEWAAAGRIG